MTDLEKLKATFDDLGIDYAEIPDGQYTHIFMGGCTMVYSKDKKRYLQPQELDLEVLSALHGSFEFESGSLKAWPSL